MTKYSFKLLFDAENDIEAGKYRNIIQSLIKIMEINSELSPKFTNISILKKEEELVWKEEYCLAFNLDHTWTEREDGSRFCFLCKKEEENDARSI